MPETQGQLLRHPWWRAVQNMVDNTLAKVPELPTGWLCHERTSWRHLRSPYQGRLPCNQGGACWLLLVKTQGWCPSFHKKMQTMPTVCKHSMHPSSQPPHYELTLALFHVGNRHTKTTTKGPGVVKYLLVVIDYFTEEAIKLRAGRRYNTKVQPWSFQPNDLVWRVRGKARKDPWAGKLGPN